MGIPNFIASGTTPEWVVSSFPIIRIILIIAMVLASVVMIFCILMQPSNEGGMGALSGETDTYFSKHKQKTLQGTLRRLTIVLSSAIFVMSVAFFVSIQIYSGYIGQ
ncbi:MAG: preprotein translocase subunit SecG [Firmicutes bacterium]|nr:preprotein translocase subunit SecG [Bacillota bacterium]MCL1954106.1 preprotein translocase subunit SecG [Bacillota bacterium]